MKKQIAFFVFIATLACCSVSKADITNAWWNTATPVDLTCSYIYPFSGNTLDMDGVHHTMNAARMVGEVQTTDPLDPTLFLGAGVNNDTGYLWNGYQVNVFMSVPFTFVGTPTVSDPTATWFVAGVTGPSLVGPGQYEGSIFYSAGIPFGMTGELDYNYAIHFASSTDYAFTQEMIPSLVPVPEPSTIALLAIGGLGFAMRLRRNSRKDA